MTLYVRMAKYYAYFKRDLLETAKISFPILISLSFSILSGVIDTVVLGRFSILALSSAVIGTSIFVIFVTAVNGLLRSMIPQYFSASDSREKARVVFNVGALALCVSTALCLIIVNLKSFLFFFGFEIELSAHAYNYLKILMWGLIPLSLSMVVTNLFIVSKYTKPLLKISVLSFLVNVLITVPLVFGLTGGEPMGEKGAAVGTVLSYIFSLTYGMLLYVRQFGGRGPIILPVFSLSTLRQSFIIGIPISAAVVTKFTAMSMLAIWIAQAGESYVAAFGILNNVASIVFIFPIAYGQAQLSRLGDSDKFVSDKEAHCWLYACLLNITLITIMVALSLYLIKSWLIRQYTSDESVTMLFENTLPLVLIAIIFDSIQATSGIILTHFKDTFFSFISIVTGYFLVCIPAVYFFSETTSPDIVFHVYTAMVLCLFLLSILQVARLSRMIVRA
ncbi:MATE family efflux transporter [Endozoicomonas sp. 4G]|uniref:MATE family efflux transporter n=1 Tax=Endozoicomonas sp. 4G TaxID=2872754 RepID=UPI002078CF32|nr:MATE family efflux transporter [Endozoicomonas sp. 4G]